MSHFQAIPSGFHAYLGIGDGAYPDHFRIAFQIARKQFEVMALILLPGPFSKKKLSNSPERSASSGIPSRWCTSPLRGWAR